MLTPIVRMAGQWCLAITFIALFGAHTIDPLSVAAGLGLTWVLWALFLSGARSTSSPALPPARWSVDEGLMRLLPWLSVGAVVSGVYVAHFYTGSSLEHVVSTISEGGSLYQSYQTHFAEQQLGLLSVRKFLPIAAGALLKFTLLAVVFQAVVVEDRASVSSVMQVVLASGGYIYFSIARGTTFEIFELVVLLWFAFLMRAFTRGSRRVRLRHRLILLVGVTLLLLSFSYNIGARSGFEHARECLTFDICLDERAALYRVSPAVGDVSFRLTTYGAFGVLFSSQLAAGPLTSSPELGIAALVPGGWRLYGAPSPRDLVCGPMIDCGAAWTPDMVVFTQAIGLLGLMVVVAVLGRVSTRIALQLRGRADLAGLMVLYFILLGLLSLPVGNFITTSSSNQLSLLAALAVYAISRLRARSSAGQKKRAFLFAGGSS